MKKTIKSNNVNKLKQAIASCCERRDYLTFIELTRKLDERFQLRGPFCLEFPGTNMIIWDKMSDCLSEALITLIEEDIIVLQTVPAIVYVCDGLIKSPSAGERAKPRIKVPHWAPCCLRPRSKVTERELARYKQYRGGESNDRHMRGRDAL